MPPESVAWGRAADVVDVRCNNVASEVQTEESPVPEAAGVVQSSGKPALPVPTTVPLK